MKIKLLEEIKMGARQDRKKRKAEKKTDELKNNVEELIDYYSDHISSFKTDERRAKFKPLQFYSVEQESSAVGF
ncbi:MAG: hypothetical protein IPN57_08025 [Ignavibacteria bacterium]|nr:hypothetical protein [Ignavibacteria bacterium]